MTSNAERNTVVNHPDTADGYSSGHLEVIQTFLVNRPFPTYVQLANGQVYVGTGTAPPQLVGSGDVDYASLAARVDDLETATITPYAGVGAVVTLLTTEYQWPELQTTVTVAEGVYRSQLQILDLEEWTGFIVQGNVISSHTDARFGVVFSVDDGVTWRWPTDGSVANNGTGAPAGCSVLASTASSNPRVSGLIPAVIDPLFRTRVLVALAAWTVANEANPSVTNVTLQLFR